MNDTSHHRGSSYTGSALMGIAVGALVGAGLALLLAPASGERTRKRIASVARRWNKSARHTLDQARDTMADLGVDTRSAVEAGRRAFKHGHQNSNHPRPGTRTALKD